MATAERAVDTQVSPERTSDQGLRTLDDLNMEGNVLNKVVFVETGRQDGSTAEFIPNLNNFSSNTAVSTDGTAPSVSSSTRLMAISGGVLDTLGPLNNCEVSRCALSGTTAKGWFFVAGLQGVAVLSEDDGSGWDTSTNVGLGFGFTGINATMSFKRLGSLTNIRKIACDGTNLYVLTSTSLVRIPLSAANFSTAGSASLPGAETIATVASVTGYSDGVFYDFIASSRLGLIGTSHGLYRVSNGGSIISGSPSWIEVKVTNGTDTFSLNQIVHLSLLSAKRGGYEEGGNLYATAADISSNLATIYRFDVGDTRVTGGSAIDNDTVARITEYGGEIYFFTFGNFRTLFHTDGTFLFHLNSRHFGNTDFLKYSVMRDAPSKLGTVRGSPVNLDLTSSAVDINLLVRNSASGAWIVPGDWGIRVNE